MRFRHGGVSGRTLRFARRLVFGTLALLFVPASTGVSGSEPCLQESSGEALSGKLTLLLPVHQKADAQVRFELNGIDPRGPAQRLGQATYPAGTGHDIAFSIPIDCAQCTRFDRFRLTVIIATNAEIKTIISANDFALGPEQLGSFLRLAIQPTPRPIE